MELKVEAQTQPALPNRRASYDMLATDLAPLPPVKDLPESIYGAAMMAAVRSSQSINGAVHGVTFCVYAGLILNVYVQAYVLWCTKVYVCGPSVRKIRDLYGQYHEEVWPNWEFSQDAWDSFARREDLCQVPLSQPIFFVVLLVIWTGAVFVDLKESLLYMYLWCRLDRPTNSRLTTVENEEGCVVTKAASWKAKAVVVLFIMLPKVLIAVFLWWLGARWLAATASFGDLVLNAVALAFITELDELIYMVIMPEDIQALVGIYKLARHPHQVDTDEAEEHEHAITRDCKFRYRMMEMVGSLTFVMALPLLYMYHFQQVLPGYKWDVHTYCEPFIQAFIQD